MQLDKSPGVIIMDKHRYHEKYLLLLHTCNFKKLDYDPTKTTEEKIQRILQKMKKNKNETRICMFISKWILSQQFYGTAKVHKLFQNSTADDLLLPPIISKIGSAT